MSMFDPETGKVIDPEALRSLQFNGQGMRVPAVREDRAAGTKTVEVVSETDGSSAGYHVHHDSGRVDAVATPPIVNAGITLPPIGMEP